MGLKDVEGLVAGAGRCGDGTGCEGAVSAPRSLLSDVPMVKAGRGKRGVSIAVGGDVPVLGLNSEVGLGPGCGVLEAADRASIGGGQTHVGAESLISNGVAAGPDMKVGFSHVGEQDVPMVAPPRSDSVFPPISTNYVQIRRGQHAGPVADLLRVVPGHEEVLT